MLALVTKSKPIYGNKLAYDVKAKEYVYIHSDNEVWRVPAIDESLFLYFTRIHSKHMPIDFDELTKLKEYPIFHRYELSCQ